MTSAQNTFFRRLTSTLGLWALILVAVLLNYDYLFCLLIAVMSLVALWEYFRMLKASGTSALPLTGTICAAVFLGGGFWALSSHGPEHSYDFEMAVLVCFLIGICARQMFQRSADKSPLEAMAYTVFGLLYIPWLFSFVTKIIYLTPRLETGATTGQYYVLYLLLVTKFSDMGAYVFGSLFGRHPFAPHISPNKTWEGFAGALATSLLGSYWLYALIPGKLSAFRFEDVTVLGLLLGFGAVLGDLAESVIKRSARAKDSSHLLPGIGGTLDLIDSLLFTGPILFFYMRMVLGIS
jgi:phosphatidate cytidylyltransferase